MIKLFLFGIFMGIADLIPGVSGGSIAFILGVYDDLLVNLHNFLAIFKLDLEHFKKTNFKFLFSLAFGIITALVVFAKFFNYILSDKVYKAYLFIGCFTYSYRVVSNKLISSLF